MITAEQPKASAINYHVELCEVCDRQKVRECGNCKKPICQHHGYRLEQDILCAECHTEAENEAYLAGQQRAENF